MPREHDPRLRAGRAVTDLPVSTVRPAATPAASADGDERVAGMEDARRRRRNAAPLPRRPVSRRQWSTTSAIAVCYGTPGDTPPGADGCGLFAVPARLNAVMLVAGLGRFRALGHWPVLGEVELDGTVVSSLKAGLRASEATVLSIEVPEVGDWEDLAAALEATYGAIVTTYPG